ncbi:MAG TPA: tetratricopeptide repeat protein, partial [Bryobacteraceae bacterium]|nr:tetratricopeptide repeat protein [Bryobacteraceae bacterium]
RVTGARWRSAVVAFLFALHPLHVESVAWVAERKDVLSGLFFFLALWAYLLYVERPGIRRYLLLMAAVSCGLASKPMLVTLPLILLLLDLWPLRRARSCGGKETFGRLIWEKAPVFALVSCLALVTFFAQRGVGAVATLDKYPLSLRLQNAVVSYVIYIVKTVWPSGLAVIYPYPALPVWEVAGSAAILIGLTWLALQQRYKRAYFTVGWFWYLAMLLPVIGLVQVGSQSRADRYMYLPMAGIGLIVAWGGWELLERRPQWKRAAPALAVAAIVACAVVTWIQLGYWSGTEPLFQHALAVTERNAVAHLKLAELYLEQNRFDEARGHAVEAARLDPVSAEARLDLGTALAKLGRNGEAVSEFRNAVTLQPENARTHLELSMELPRVGQAGEALREARVAVQLGGDDAISHNNLGNALAAGGDFKEAIPEFNEAIRWEPDNARFHYNLGVALGQADQVKEAAAAFREAVRLDPSMATAHFNLGTALVMQDQLDEGIAQIEEALRLNPSLPGAQQSLEYAKSLKNGTAK